MRIGLIIVLFFAKAQLFAQTPFLRALDFTYNGANLNVQDVLVAESGLMYLASDNKLFYGDLNNLVSLVELNEERINAIVETAGDTIVIGTSSGSIYKYHQGILDTIADSLTAISVLLYHENGIWIGTKSKGISLYARGKIHSLDSRDGLSDNHVYSIFQLGHDKVVCGTDRGLNMVSFSGASLKVDNEILRASITVNCIVESVAVQNDGNIVFGTMDSGAFMLDPRSGKVSKLMNINDEIVSICILDNELWMAGKTGNIYDVEFFKRGKKRTFDLRTQYGISRLDKILQTSFNYQVILANNKVYITPGEWLEKIVLPSELLNSNPKALAVDPDGIIYLASDIGIFRYLEALAEWQKLEIGLEMDFRAISSMRLIQGELWIASLTEGIYRIAADRKTGIHYDMSNGLADNTVFCLIHAGTELYYGSMNGAGSLNLTERTDRSLPYDFEKTRGVYVYDIAIGADQDLYLATDGKGIIRLGKASYSEFRSDTKEKNIIYSITADQLGQVWFASVFFGLFKYVNEGEGTFQAFNDRQLLAVLVDDNNKILGLERDGIFIFSEAERKHWNVHRSFGFGEMELTTGMIDRREGFIYFITKEEILIYQPNRFSFLDNLPVQIQDKYLFLRESDKFEKTVFKSNENHISFRVHFPWYFESSGVQYQYVLEGYSTDTISTTNSLISFTQLPPGNYTFKVRGNVRDASLGTIWTAYSFQIRQAWYSSAWFLALAVFLVLLGIYVAFIFFKRKEKLENERIRQKLFQEVKLLNNQINPHFLFNSLNNLVSLIDIEPEKAITFTEKLSDFYRFTVTYKDELLIDLSKELGLSETFLYLQNIRFNGLIRSDISEDLERLNSFIPPLTLQILIENAIKHNTITSEIPLLVKFYTEGETIVVENEIHKKSIAGHSTKSGLQFIKERYEILSNRKVTVEDDGKIFRVKLPILKEKVQVIN